jgi:hypothetical protein
MPETLLAFHGDPAKKIGRPRNDLTGRTFGRLTVTEFSDSNPSGNVMWKCRCQCGGTTIVSGSDLTRNQTVSCGCYRRENGGKSQRSHGMTGTPEYRTWTAMRHRCDSPSNTHYADYGGRGIKVDPRWERFESFLEDMGRRPSLQHSIDRIDNSLGYYKSNCRWATRIQQANNTRSNRTFEHSGRRQSLSAWSIETGISYVTLLGRINRLGWSIDRALTTSVRRKHQ